MKCERLEVVDLGPKGDGISRHKGAPIFVARGLPGDVVEVTLEKDDENIWRANIEKIITPSPQRREPPCPYYARCGGCSLQHASDELYQNFKKDIIFKSLRRYNVKANEVRPVAFLPEGIRQRATFAAFVRNRKLTLGYYARRTHLITSVETCMVCAPALMAWRDKLKEGLVDILRDNAPADLFLQLVGNACDVVITGPVGKKGKLDAPTRQAILAWGEKTGVARISYKAKPRDVPETVFSATPVLAQFGALQVNLPAGAFLQPSPLGETALAAHVVKALPTKLRQAADLFSGCGTFTGHLIQAGATSVDAFDNAGPAIQALKNGLKGTPHTANARDLFKAPLLRDQLNKYDCVIFDPPRAGAKEQCAQLAKSKVPVIIAVSCNPATFARDASILQEGGYKLNWVQPVDQFIWSHHIELVARFSK